MPEQVNDALWAVLLDHVTDADAYSIGYSAYHRYNFEAAESAWVRAVAAGNSPALNNLGVLLAEQGRGGEAEEPYRRAADAGYDVTPNGWENPLAGDRRRSGGKSRRVRIGGELSAHRRPAA